MTEKDELAERLKKIRETLKLKQKDFAASIDMSGSYLSEIEGGKTSPGFDFFYKLTKHYKINPLYLMHGEGTMFLDGQAEEEKKKKPGASGAGVESLYERDSELHELMWYMERSNLVRYSVLEFFCRYKMQKRKIIEEEIGTSYPSP